LCNLFNFSDHFHHGHDWLLACLCACLFTC
jgi:hypothetical protein